MGISDLSSDVCSSDLLQRLELTDVGDALHGSAAALCREFLVAINGHTFLQAKLEPIAAGNAVAGPIVEIFVRDDALDRLVVRVGRRIGRGEDETVDRKSVVSGKRV